MAKFLLVLCLAFSLSCGGSRAFEQNPLKIVKEAKHSNGLSIGIPEGYEAAQTQEGFRVEPANNGNAGMRTPVVINISYQKGPDTASYPPGQTKSINGRSIEYSIEKSEGGSAGETYSLSARESAGGGTVRYSQNTQSKYGEPDFGLAWQIIENTSIK